MSLLRTVLGKADPEKHVRQKSSSVWTNSRLFPRGFLSRANSREKRADAQIIAVGRVSTANGGGVGGAKGSQESRNHAFFVISLPENVRERDQVATRPAKALRLVDLLSSEGIVNLPTSVFLDSMRLRSWQSLADTGGACNEQSRKFDSV